MNAITNKEELIHFFQQNKKHLPFKDHPTVDKIVGTLKADKEAVLGINQDRLKEDWNSLEIFVAAEEGGGQYAFHFDKSVVNEVITGKEVKEYLKLRVYPIINEVRHPDLFVDLQWFISEMTTDEDDLVLVISRKGNILERINLANQRGNVRVVVTNDANVHITQEEY